ncbi:MAG: hypothetical protein JOZ57_12310 [Abitibacteriaceae bacterium]|nr:hypothetical protein [Abditibacteriaceae bacterium]
MPDEVQTGNGPQAGTSKLALLTAFIAGAFAAWILISVNIEQQRSADMEAMASEATMVVHKPVAQAPKPAPGVTVHTSAPKAGAAKTGAPKTASNP